MAKKPSPDADPQPSTPNPPPSAPPPRARQSSAPECPYCKIPCVAGHSTPIVTYYYCPNRRDRSCPGNYSVSKPRPEAREMLRRRPPADPNEAGFSAR